MVNPARAGMIPATSYPMWDGTRKPRASGDDPVVFVEDRNPEP